MPLLQRDLHEQLRTESSSLHQRVATLARGLDPEQLLRRPEPAGWSVGEVLEHLCIADALYAPVLTTLVHRARPDAGAPLREWRPTLLGRIMVDALERPRPLRAPRAFRPGPTPRNGVVEDFLSRDARMLHRIDESASLDWRALRLFPPTIPVKLLRLNLGDVFRVHVVHVRRHLGQMERVARQVSQPGLSAKR